MKSLVIVLAVFAVFNSVRTESEVNIYDNINAQYLRSYLKQRQAASRNLTAKIESICPGKGEEFEEALLKVQECAEEIEERMETACSIIKNHFITCTKPMVQIFEECAPVGSKDVPNFLFNNIISVVDYVCKANGEHIFELMNPCIMKPNYRFSRCERRVRTKIQHFAKKVPTKTDLCDFAQSFKPCLQSHLQYSCGNEITKESVLGVYEAMFAGCSDINEINDLTEIEILTK